jgi:hypothetical protein
MRVGAAATARSPPSRLRERRSGKVSRNEVQEDHEDVVD